jgi:hypothetical protein
MGNLKLPSNMAYPVSLVAMREKLAKVPQSAEIVVDYRYTKTLTERRFQKTKMAKSNRTFRDSSHDIIEARFSRSQMLIGTLKTRQQDGDPLDSSSNCTWTLTIRAVPTDDLALIRSCLEEDGYANIANWFVETFKPAPSIGRHTLVVSLDGRNLKYERWDDF